MPYQYKREPLTADEATRLAISEIWMICTSRPSGHRQVLHHPMTRKELPGRRVMSPRGQLGIDRGVLDDLMP